jgi:hypothetical protein
MGGQKPSRADDDLAGIQRRPEFAGRQPREPGPVAVPARRQRSVMLELRQCRTCRFDYSINEGGRHDCARFRGAIKLRDPAAPWIREQVFDLAGLPRAEADGCPGWRGWDDEERPSPVLPVEGVRATPGSASSGLSASRGTA